MKVIDNQSKNTNTIAMVTHKFKHKIKVVLLFTFLLIRKEFFGKPNEAKRVSQVKSGQHKALFPLIGMLFTSGIRWIRSGYKKKKKLRFKRTKTQFKTWSRIKEDFATLYEELLAEYQNKDPQPQLLSKNPKRE